MSFQFPTGQDVTVVVSKNGGRYRLQSDTLEAMWLVGEADCEARRALRAAQHVTPTQCDTHHTSPSMHARAA